MAVNTQDFELRLKVKDDASASIQKVSNTAASAAGGFSKLGGSIVVLNQAFELSKKAFDAIVGPLKDAVGSYVEYERAVNKVSIALKLQGQFTEQHTKSFQDFAQALQETTGVSDDAVLSLVALAKTSGLSDTQTKELIKTSVDLSTVMDKDVNGSFRELLGTLSGSSGRIGKYIQDIDNLSPAALRAGDGITLIASKVKGFAEQDAKSLGGSMVVVKRSFEDFTKTVGKTIVEAVELPKVLAFINQSIKYLSTEFERISPRIIAIGEAFRNIDFSKMGVSVGAATLAFTVMNGSLLALVTTIGVAYSQVMVFLAAFAAIDIVLRNLNQLDKLFKSVGFAAQGFGESLQFALIGSLKLLAEFAKYLAEVLKKFTGFGDSIVKFFDSKVLTLDKKLKDSALRFSKNMSDAKEAGKGLDTGVSGEIFKFIEQSTKKIPEQIKEAAKEQDKWNESANRTVANTQDQLKALKELKDQTQKLRNEESLIGQNSIQQLFTQSRLSKETLNEKLRQLREEGLLVGKNGALLESEIKKQKSLLDIIAQKKALEEVKGILNTSKSNVEQKGEDVLLKNMGPIEAVNNKAKLDLEKAAKDYTDQVNKINSLNNGADKDGALEKLAKDFQDLNKAINSGASAEKAKIRTDAMKQYDKEYYDYIAAIGEQNGVRESELMQYKLDLKQQEYDQIIKNGFAQEMFYDEEGKALLRSIEAAKTLNKIKGEKEITNKLDAENSLSGQLDSMNKGMTESLSGVTTAMSAVSGMISQAQGLVDFIPNTLSSLTKLFDSITNLPATILQNLDKLITSVLNMIVKFIPNLFAALPDILLHAVTFLFEKLPDAIQQLIDAIPDIFQKLLERLPEIITKLITGLIVILPKVVLLLAQILISVMPRVALAFVRFVALELPKAIWNGLKEAFNQLVQMIKNALSGNFKVPKSVSELPTNIAKETVKLAKEASQIFQVKDFTEALPSVLGGGGRRGSPDSEMKEPSWFEKLRNWFGKVTEGFARGIGEVLQGVGQFLANILKPIAEALANFIENTARTMSEWFKKIFGDLDKKIFDNVLKPIGNAISNFFTMIQQAFGIVGQQLSTVFGAIATAISDVFSGKIFKQISTFFEDIGTKIAGAFSGPFLNFQNNVIDLGNKLSTFTKNLGTALSDTFKNAATAISDGFKNLLKGDNVFKDMGTKIWNGLKDGLSGVGEVIRKQLADLNPANLFEKMFKMDYKGQGFVEKTLTKISGANIDIPYANFAKGLVPGQPVTAGDSEMNDRILALVSPGEAIIPRSLMADPAISSMVHMIMSGKMSVPKYGFGDVISSAGGSISNAAKSAGGTISDTAKNVGGAVSQTAKDAGGAVAQTTKNILGSLGLDQLWDQAKKEAFQVVMRAFEANKFHTGGMIPSFAGGASEVPILGQAGEFVVNRRATAQNLPTLEAMNSGRGGAGSIVIQRLEIHAKTNLTTESIRREIVPTLIEDLRRKSQDGQFILDKKGLR